MKRAIKLAMILFIVFISMGPAVDKIGAEKTMTVSPALAAPRIDPEFGRMPLSFVANLGQLDRRVDYYVAGRDKSVFFMPEGLTMALAGKTPGGKEGERQLWTVKLTFVGANPGVGPAGEAKVDTVFSYFKGQPENWRTDVPAYSRIVYRNLWPGIDLVYSGTADRLKYEFIVRPGADPSRIRLAYTGTTRLSLNGKGQLEVDTPVGGFRDETPFAYQEKDETRTSVPMTFRLEEPGVQAEGPEQVDTEGIVRPRVYGFEVGPYDPSLPLILDPATIIYCGFIGGSADDRGTSVAVDGSGNAYVTGWAGSYDFPVTVGPDLSFNSGVAGTDVFVAKVNASGTALVYCGFIGGGWDDVGSGVAVDSSGNAYVTGWTYSQDFPAIVGPGLTYHSNISQYSEAFVAKVATSGTSLAYCGFIGGSLEDRARGIALDSFGDAYISGWTESDDLPVKTGPDTSFNGAQDAFVAKVNAAGSGFVYVGYIGGLAADCATAIAVDGSGYAYVTGFTSSFPTEHFPVTVGPYLTYKGSQDAFVAKVAASGAALVYCGYIGGTGVDAGAGIAVDPSGNAYIAGTTDSGLQFPVKAGPYLVHRDGNDAFVAKVDASGAELVYSGFIGGSGDDLGMAIAVDGEGNAFVAGSTDSASDFPVTGGPFLIQAGSADAFVATVNPSGSGLIYCGFIGGSLNDEAEGIAADGSGNVFVAGYTRSNDFPVSVGPILTPGAGMVGVSDDAFIVRVSEDLPPLAPADLHPGTVTATAVNIIWTDRSTNETGFKVERKTGVSGTWSQIGTVGANVTAYQDAGRTEGTTYVYRVRAYNSIGNSGYSNEATILTRPAAPTDLTAAAINERRVDLSWTDHSASETGFRVERKVNAGDPWASVGTVASNVTTFSDTSVLETTTYSYRVLAFNSGGDSDPSNVATATTPALTIPVAPSGLQAAPLSASQARLTWVDNSYNEDGFKVERKTGTGGTWAQVGTAAAGATSLLDSGLAESTTYYYRVRAYNNAGDSDYSNEAPVTTPANQPALRLPIADIAFGNVNECAFADRTTVIYNDGGASLTVTSIGLASGSTDFSYQTPATPFSIPPLGSQAITVRFSPLNTGAASAVIAVHSNDPGNPNVTFNVSGTGYIPNIGLTLQVLRQVERAWIIRREYGRIMLTVTKSAPFNVTTYRLSRRTGTGTFQTIKDFTEADLPAGSLTYNDTFLAAGTSYSYKVEAYDCGGRIIASSSEAGAVSPQPPPTTKRENRTIKR